MRRPFSTRRLPPSLAGQIQALRHLPRLFASMARTSPALLAAVVLLRALRAVQPPLVLYVGKLIVDEIVLQSRTPAPGPELADWLASGRLAALGGWIALEFVLVAAANGLGRLSALAENVLGELHGDAMGVAMIAHAAALDLAMMEGGAEQDRLQRARAQTVMGASLLGQVLGQAQDLVTAALLLAGLAVYAPALVLLLAAGLIPGLAGETHFNALAYGLNAQVTPERRQIEYIRYVGSDPETAKEVKLFGLGGFLAARFAELARAIHLANRRLAVRRSAWGTLFATLGSLAYYAAYALVAWRTVKGELSLGDFTFLTGSLLRLNGLLERLMLGLTQIAQRALYLDDLFSFLDLKPAMARAPRPVPFPQPLRQGVVFDDVGFRYPGKEAWAVRGLSFRLGAGETVALVGENGAGKTTIVKLLSRLYDPDEGRILIDGVDLRDMDLDDLRSHVGVVFQDFTRYHLTLAENIAVGRIGALADEPRLRDAAERSLADQIAARLPEGYRQMLGRRFFGGVDLSGGEWQRLGIARAYFREADILVLDEPTAALDARAEAEVFERFRTLAHAKTALIISHRFSTVRMADRILVIEGGAIREEGQPRRADGTARPLCRAVHAPGRRLPVAGAPPTGSRRWRGSARPISRSRSSPGPRDRRAPAARASP